MDSSRTKKVTIDAPESKPETEKGRKIYRAILDMIRRHDEILKQEKGFRDVFLPEAIMLRDRLQEYCEKLMFFLPAEYGRKAEELMWRKVYYDIIQLMKLNKKHVTLNSSLLNAIYTHLFAATGYYHHLLHRLQSELDLNLEGVVDFNYLPEAKAHRKPHFGAKIVPDAHVQQWAREACYRCLVYLGDIARYRLDYLDGSNHILSQRYYYQALALYPDMGMPYNQLGTLAGSSRHNLDAAYYYIRCLICPNKFDGAKGNLMRLFERNRKKLQELNQHQQTSNLTWEQQRSRDVKRFVVRFLHLLEIFFNKPSSVDGKVVQELCQSTLYDFNLCMFIQSSSSSLSNVPPGEEEKAYQLEDDVVFKIIVICLAMITLMQREGNKQMAAVIAFSLALFSHILNHVIMRLQAAMYELENPRKPLDSGSSADGGDTADIEEDQEFGGGSVKRNNSVKSVRQRVVRKDSARTETRTEDENDTGQKKVVKKSKMRRLRRRRDSGSSGESDEEQVTRNDSDLSEGELSESGSGMESANHVDDNTSSDQSEDELLESQELKAGFSQPVEEEIGKRAESKTATPNAGLELVTGLSGKPNSGATTDEVNRSLDYVKDIPMDWLSDAANILSNTLQFSFSASDAADLFRNGLMDDGKPVRVPPGFEASTESKHVMEISEKLANFDIDTDTDISVYPTDNETSTVTESELETENETDKESVIDKTEQTSTRVRRLLTVSSAEGLMSAIKIYCDWMTVNPHVIITCAKISSSLWFRLSVLLNFLPGEGDLAKKEVCGAEDLKRVVSNSDYCHIHQMSLVKLPALPEDVHLRKFPPLETAQQQLDFSLAAALDLSPQQQAIVRICSLRRFGYFVIELNSVQFTYEPNNRMFYGPQQQPTTNPADDKLNEQKMVDSEAKRNQLMKDMAQLRLQAEVNQLEGSLRRHPAPAPAGGSNGSGGVGEGSESPSNLPPYLVLDAWSLCDQLAMVKQLSTSSRFIIIVPLTVVDHLDFLKKDNAGAREAIRWLENEFRKGNRYIRAQKPHERIAGPPHLTRMSKRDKEAMRALQMIECCKYLAQQSSGCVLSSMVCFLSNLHSTTSNQSIRTKEIISHALKEGLMMESIKSFHSRWRSSVEDSKG